MRPDDKASLLGASPPSYEQFQASRRLLPRFRRRRLAVIVALVLGATVLLHSESVAIWATTSTNVQEDFFLQDLTKCHASVHRSQQRQAATIERENPRWNPKTGQKSAIVLKNATLFDGESSLADPVDILFESGLIKSVTVSSAANLFPRNAEIQDLEGKFVTPGLVDMHSHHLLIPFPQVAATRDVNEMPLLGPLTTFVRAIDGIKPYDPTIKIIASGGVTSSLILPGSGNIVGGEAYMVKNQMLSGADGEPVVEELLLEHGLPETSRQRYLKMACGENPKGVYGHTRMGLVWLLREHLDKAKQVKDRQDAWCRNALEIESSTLMRKSKTFRFLRDDGRRREAFDLDTAIAMLRGDLNVNVHCYEPQDFERMLSVLHEFGVHPSAFHHALDAWKVPELLKKLERNVTIATFAEHGFFKHEGYGANLRGPKILDDHGINVALKSDHTGEGNYAKYLMYQASVSYAFGLSKDKALQSVTSIPARSVQQGHRIGYARPGYDADLVVWDVHPLQVAATPTQVFVDGKPLFDENAVSKIFAQTKASSKDVLAAPQARVTISQQQKEDVCNKIQSGISKILFTGIRKSLVELQFTPPIEAVETASDLAVLVENGRITCLNTHAECLSSVHGQEGIVRIDVPNGYITPGLIAFGNNLGIQAISSDASTGDGSTAGKGNALDEKKSLHFAKYGIHLKGRAFTRSRVGGVTKAITAPLSGGGFLQGVSVGLRTSDNATILNGGIWKADVAIHFSIGQSARGDDTPTVASGIERLRQVLTDGQVLVEGSHSIYAQAANGSLPVVVAAVNEDDIAQLVLIKHDFPSVNLVIFGGHAAPLVAKSLAAASIPVILTGNRGAPDSWEKQGTPVGPPLTESPAQILAEAGVFFGIGIRGDSKIYGLAQEGYWAGKFAGFSEKESIALVSTNIEKILGLKKEDKDGQSLGQIYDRDFVVWSGNPLKGEGSVVVAVQDDGKVGDCWPDSEGAVL